MEARREGVLRRSWDIFRGFWSALKELPEAHADKAPPCATQLSPPESDPGEDLLGAGYEMVGVETSSESSSEQQPGDGEYFPSVSLSRGLKFAHNISGTFLGTAGSLDATQTPTSSAPGIACSNASIPHSVGKLIRFCVDTLELAGVREDIEDSLSDKSH